MLDLVGLGRKIYPFFFRENYSRMEFWFARFFLYLLALSATPQAIRLLAEFASAKRLGIRQAALGNLQKNGGQQHINEICQVWYETRNETLGQLLYERGWLADQPADLRVVSALQAERGWFLKSTGENLELLIKVIFQEQPELAQRALAYFTDFSDFAQLKLALQAEPAFSEIVQDIPGLTNFFERHKVGLGLVMALHAERPELIASAGAEVVAPLLELASTHEKLGQTARGFILALRNNAAHDALCELALHEGLEVNLAKTLTLEAGFYPSDKYRRALFFFLTEQWAKYETLDFDVSLMQAIYESADERTRKRITRLGRLAGRAELTKIVGGRNRNVRQLSAEEWDLLTQNLIEKQRWAEAYEFAQIAPPVHAAALLKALGKANWWPEKPAEQLALLDLAARAEKIDTTKPPLGRQLKPQARLKLPIDTTDQNVQMVFSATSGLVAISHNENNVSVWDAKTGDLIAHILPDEPIPDMSAKSKSTKKPPTSFVVAQLALSPDGRMLAILDFWQIANQSIDYRVRLYNLAEKRMWPLLVQDSVEYRYSYNANFARGYFTLNFSPDNQFLALLTQSFIWNKKPVAQIWQIDSETDYKIIADIGSMIKFANTFSADSRQLIYQNNHNNQLIFHSFKTGRQNVVTSIKFYGLHNLYTSPNGKYLITIDNNQIMKLWQVYPDMLEVATIAARHSGVFSVAFSPDGKRLATGHSQVVRLWELPGLKPVKTVWANRTNKAVIGLSFSEDGQSLQSVDKAGNVKWWSTRLARAAQRPTEIATQDYLLFARKSQQDIYLPDNERVWLEFLEALFAAHTAYDIELSDVAPNVEAGQYDSELEG